ncbi:MAG: Fic family protein [Mangrovibacterium sp.]
MEANVIKRIENLHQEYRDLNLSSIVDYDKYKLYSLVTSSTQLEGSTLDESDTKLLLDDRLTAKGKPILDHKMVEDNHDAILFAIDAASRKTPLSSSFLQELNGRNMHQTGTVQKTLSGEVVDGAKGEFRKDSSFAQAIGTYPNWTKIPELVNRFCDEFNRQIIEAKNDYQSLITSFDAHVNLILIHPWMDGNKRTSRLLMTYIQHRANLPLTRVFKEDSKEYWAALKETKEMNDLKPIRIFMLQQHEKTLRGEIFDYKKSENHNRGFHLLL